MSRAEELVAVESALPATWCPTLPLVERIKRLANRSGFVDLLAIHERRADIAEEQRVTMRATYLGLLVYARRFVALELAVSDLIAEAHRNGRVDMQSVKRLAEARASLGDAVSVEPPDGALAALMPFLRGKPTRIMLTGPQLDAFRQIIGWIHGLIED